MREVIVSIVILGVMVGVAKFIAYKEKLREELNPYGFNEFTKFNKGEGPF